MMMAQLMRATKGKNNPAMIISRVSILILLVGVLRKDGSVSPVP
jgi:hypothetical protein